MSTGDWALVVSIFSFIVSLAGFIWNVWSKFIYPKAKVRVSFYSGFVMGEGFDGVEMLTLNATNYGPGAITLHLAVGRSRVSRFKKLESFMLNPLHDFPAQTNFTLGPFSGGLPKKVDVGESFSAFFVKKHAAIAIKNVVDVGFTDTFGRCHWARRRAVAKARSEVKEAFAADSETPILE
ncbi:hypothetical protein G6L63_21140 [Agrobacterium vitis]|uniref:Uncharacterized protein n=1 Tax=Agrobacterium vitis TaxID=373 RepID=A0A368NUG6_AGRVI|nr:hypothetical protein [Agrobacterium vitis]KAA3517561.1 hypothetical protein DXM22_07560 [Agrobacterium vitis]KAA3526962.1 hypothetical protein DXT89_13555 [Agrobacterium vitis]MCF1477013.1 hypothetical protein [Agrobacterium vitis]MUZ95803.1 hypothetical protein [Agrobacterium vitis]MVA29682.1 hypothetical protein [Agrobacterium vitis]